MTKDEFIREAMHNVRFYSRDDAKQIITAIAEALYKKSELKVLRTKEAKQFPLIGVKKDGDVGFDLPAVFPYREQFNDKGARADYTEIWECEGVPIEEIEIGMREEVTIRPQQRGVIPTGIKLEIPDGYWASIEARSSTSKQMLVVPKGVIDEGYRGELFAVLLNVGDKPVTIKHGDRFVQLIIHKRCNSDISIVEVDKISESERGETGFGSTGRNDLRNE